MGQPVLPYRIFSLGDSAITIDFGNSIDEAINREVIARFHEFTQQPLPGMIEAVPAYSSLTLYYDLFLLKKKLPAGLLVSDWIKENLEQRLSNPVKDHTREERLVRLPVCYEKEFAPDLQSLALSKNIPVEELVSLHTGKNYKVYMLGFLPGFPYMGEVDERIAMPRKPQPVTVAAGSVGIAGKQTGIYPLVSPGGWQIIGRTPVKLFDSEGERSTLLQTGDTVQFYSISRDEFENY
ncbi:MAG TPA: 5-oxoprolinase subunit PxpB [Chitinophagaceae bacterium]|jgi:inhibitor of KinA|nr:5-oxoprolinase subunit PxpB [Chitinophagaceae bacterium]